MSEVAERLKTESLRLSEAERWDLVDALMESLPEPASQDEDLDTMLTRRRAKHEAGLDPGIPAAEFFRSLRENRP